MRTIHIYGEQYPFHCDHVPGHDYSYRRKSVELRDFFPWMTTERLKNLLDLTAKERRSKSWTRKVWVSTTPIEGGVKLTNRGLHPRRYSWGRGMESQTISLCNYGLLEFLGSTPETLWIKEG